MTPIEQEVFAESLMDFLSVKTEHGFYRKAGHFGGIYSAYAKHLPEWMVIRLNPLLSDDYQWGKHSALTIQGIKSTLAWLAASEASTEEASPIKALEV